MFLRYQHSNYSGDFGSRLKDFALDKYFGDYPSLVKHDWLRPAFHVPVPRDWFLREDDESAQWPPLQRQNIHWADAYDEPLVISENLIGKDEWFVHPLVRRGSSRVDFFDHATSNHVDFAWGKVHHSEGRNFVPAFDYFYEWQLFRFADVVHSMRSYHQHFWQPGDHEKLAQYAAETTPADFDREAFAPGWSTRAQAFTWLAHFIAFQSAFRTYKVFQASALHLTNSMTDAVLVEKLAYEEKLGAKKLMSWLEITPEVFEQSLRDQILTLAKVWRGKGRQYHDTAVMRPLWHALQEQIREAFDWLCLVNGDTPIVYLDRLRHDYFGQHEWAQLEDVYSHPRWKAARKIASQIKESASHEWLAQHVFISNFSPSPIELINMASKIDAFGGYLDALGRFLEDSEFTSLDDRYRTRSRPSWYRVMALMAEIAFTEVAGDRRIIKKRPGKKNQKEKICEAVCRILCNRGEQWEQSFPSDRSGEPEEPLASISRRILSSSTRDQLILNFSLAVHFARNTTAHQVKLDAHLLYAPWADRIFDALVLFVPWALMQLQPFANRFSYAHAPE